VATNGSVESRLLSILDRTRERLTAFSSLDPAEDPSLRALLWFSSMVLELDPARFVDFHDFAWAADMFAPEKS